MRQRGDPVDEIVSKVAKNICKKYSLTVCERGGASEKKGTDITLVIVGFQYCGSPVTIDQGRKMVVKIQEELYEAINANRMLQHYLKQHPFPRSSIEVMLYCDTSSGNETFHPYLCTSTLYNFASEIAALFSKRNCTKWKIKLIGMIICLRISA